MPDIFPFLAASTRAIISQSLRLELIPLETPEETISFLLERGFGFAPGSIEQAFRRLENQSAFREQLLEIIPDSLIPRALHIEDHGFDISNKYMYRTRATGVEPLTGQQIDHFFTITSDTQLSPEEIYTNVLEATSGFEGDYRIQIESFEIDAAFINPNFT